MKGKTLLFTSIICLFSISAISQNKHTINVSATNVYTPDTLEIIRGDTVLFNVNQSHPTIQVSETTYRSNGNTPLTGGFGSFASPTSIVFNEPGNIFFVCRPHAFLGMKGMIVVKNWPLGTDKELSATGVNVYPNPAKSFVTVQLPQATIVQSICVLNSNGLEVLRSSVNASVSSYSINTEALNSGIYNVAILTSDKKIVSKIVIQ